MFNRVILRAMNGKSKGREFVLENEADYILGRSQDCECVLDDPFRLVSRRHCRITVHAPLVHVRDLGSRNGTQVNGLGIGPHEKRALSQDTAQAECAEHPLDDGDTLRIAVYAFRVEYDPPLPCAAAEPRNQEKLWSCNCASC